MPGLSMAVVHIDETGQISKLVTGLGVKNLNSNKVVDENTFFNIASNSKLFTGVLAVKTIQGY